VSGCVWLCVCHWLGRNDMQLMVARLTAADTAHARVRNQHNVLLFCASVIIGGRGRVGSGHEIITYFYLFRVRRCGSYKQSGKNQYDATDGGATRQRLMHA